MTGLSGDGTVALGLLVPEAPLPPEAKAIRIHGISADSRAIKPGFLFAAMPGTKADGLQFAPQAIANGAVAVLAERAPAQALPGGAVLAKVADARLALTRAAARFYPQQPKTIVAVTGTSGKTSVAHFTRQIYEALGHRSGYIGTLGVISPQGSRYGSLTTPDPVTLHAEIAGLAEAGVTHLAIEASSHGLDQRRLEEVKLAAAGFTNLSRDHLDYHGTVEAYRAAKLRLFTELLPEGSGAVVCADGGDASYFAAAARDRGLALMTVGSGGEDLTLEHVERDVLGQVLTIRHRGISHTVRLPLAGAFQAENALVAAGLALVTGEKLESVFAALETLTGVPGRIELVGTANGAACYVDYAHKPDALANVLAALRPFVRRKLVVVVGAGGDRDPGKRPLMGRVAVEGADTVIITDDNPRSEDPATIRRAILAAAPGAIEIGDRAEAITTAVRGLEPGDVLVVAGKGHETGQIIGDRTLPFSDHAAIRAAIGGSP